MLAGTRGDPPLPSAFNTNRRLHEGVSTSTALVTNIVRSSGPRAVTETLSGVDTAESSEISTGCGLLGAFGALVRPEFGRARSAEGCVGAGRSEKPKRGLFGGGPWAARFYA